MNKTVSKKKSKSPTKGKTHLKKAGIEKVASPVSKEIVGICMMGISLLIMIGVFTKDSGLFGAMIQTLFIGLFGIGGYILPVLCLIMGFFYIRGEYDKIKVMIGYLGALLLIMMAFFHTLTYGRDTSIPLLSLGYFQEAYWGNGGYIGALVARALLALLGLYGTYVVLGVLFGIWLLAWTKFPLFAWLQEKGVQLSTYWHSRPQKTAKVKQASKRVKPQEEAVSVNVPPLVEETKEQEVEAIPYFSALDEEDEKETVYFEPPSLEQMREKNHAKVSQVSNETEREQHLESLTEQNLVNPLMDYKFPPVSLLNKVPSVANKDASRKSIQNAKKLEETLASFGVEAKVTQINRGPSVTRYELQPRQGVKVSKIVNLADDIALNLAAPSIRIEAPIPGKAAVGIEVANESSEIVYLRDVIDSDLFLAFPSKLAFALGKDIAGKPVITDIGKMPHLLIAGATGSGKSVCINTLIASIIYKARPNEVKLIMIDPKVVELSVYNGIPHLMIPVVTDPKKAAGALFWAVNEMTKRYNLFAENNVRDMKGYNAKQENEENKMPQIVIIIDELADLMMTAGKEVEDAICRLAQMARAAGIHLVIATQRPSVDVITGVIKANIPSRLAFAVSSGTDSRTILDITGAEKLLGKGDMLFYPVGESKPVRIQGAFISDKEVENIVKAIATKQATYETTIMESLDQATLTKADESDEEQDELLEKAISFAKDKEKLSISMLQRYFRIGFNRAARLMDSLEAKGIVGPDEGSKPRKVLAQKQETI